MTFSRTIELRRMPLVFAILMLAALLLPMSGCGADTDDSDGEEITILRTVHVSALATDPLCGVFPSRFTIAEQDLKEQLDKLEFRSLVLIVADPKTNPTSVATSASGRLKVGSKFLSDDSIPLGAFENLPVTEDSRIEVPVKRDAASRILSLLRSPEATFYVEATACVDAVPAHFDVDAKVTFFVRR